jgi:hypothetical protein
LPGVNYEGGLLRLLRFESIRTELQAVMHDIKAMSAMAQQQPEPST